MSDENQAQERTEQPTPKRIDDARRKGQIPRSRDLTAAAVLLSGGIALYMLGGYVAGHMHGMVRRSLSVSRDEALDSSYLVPALADAAADGLRACAPVLLIVLIAAILAPLALGGWNFSTESLAPKFERLNPLKGIKRMFSLKSLVELTKALAKFGAVAVVAVLVLWHDSAALLALGREPIELAIGHAARLSAQGLIAISAGMLLIAAIDVPFQLWQHTKQMKMSREEIRQEMKESDGSPEIKGRVRQIQQEMARQRMMQEVPTADVVVTNPTHFAVALRYDEKRTRAPVVVAKGVDLVAARIREVAGEHNVAIFEAPPLARVLYRNVDIGGEVPSNLYVAVAQVLSYVFQLRVAKRAGLQPPDKPAVQVAE